ncbi:MAG TPA: cation diffusion facilitator family transporter [Gemmataceae bacterium]|nr:cation diffusion facilitator family transporter [Gemmataceae bacterium]
MSVDELYRQSRRAALLGIGLNLGLGAVKLLGGWFGHSVALLSDAVHSLGDVLTLSAVWGALLVSQRPPDREHPYGHTRLEAATGSNVALLLILTGLGIIWQSLRTLGSPPEEPAVYTLWIAAVSAVLKEGLYRYQRRVAQRTGSTAGLAVAWDHRLDAFSSTAVLAGVALAKWGGAAWHGADHLAALVVAGTILLAGASLFWTSLQELMDRQAEPEILEAVRREALAVHGVLGVEKLLVRKTGLEYLVDIHVEVNPDMSVRDGHAIAHAVKDRVVREIVPVKDVLVHIEPAPKK